MLSLPRRGCSLWHQPRRRCVNPLEGEPLTGEPDTGKPPVRFGGRGSESNRLSLPLSSKFSHSLYRSRFRNGHQQDLTFMRIEIKKLAAGLLLTLTTTSAIATGT